MKGFEMIMDHVGGYNFQIAEYGLRAVGLKLAKKPALVGAELKIGLLD